MFEGESFEEKAGVLGWTIVGENPILDYWTIHYMWEIPLQF